MQSLYKLIYHPFINYFLRNFNKFVFRIFPKIIKLPPSGTVSLKTNSGALKITTNQTNYITHLLFWNGYKNFEYSSIFEILIKKCDCFFDIGAHVGYYSLLAAKTNPQLKVYAFEPARGPQFYLNQNITINKFESIITPVNMAISNQTGSIDFYEVDNKKYSYLTYNLAGEGNAGTKTTSRNFIKNTVKTTTLSAFVNSHQTEKIDLIKIDTEGTEIDILNTSKDVIIKYQPIVICETLFNTIEHELDTFFTALEYHMYNHTEKGLEKVSTIQRTHDDGIRNCFFVPTAKTHLIAEFITN